MLSLELLQHVAMLQRAHAAPLSADKLHRLLLVSLIGSARMRVPLPACEGSHVCFAALRINMVFCDGSCGGLEEGG